MTTSIDTAPERVVPEWELCDRMQRSLRQTTLGVSEVADMIGVSRDTVSRWLHGRNKPSKAALMVWAGLTGVDQGWLETGKADLQEEAGQSSYAIRDLNPEPADSEGGRHLALVWSDNRRLSVNRIPAGSPPPVPLRPYKPGLRAVSA